jgi:toxin ParE1/3/4
MAYKVIVSLRAQKEIENAIDFYALYSSDAPKFFIVVLNEAFQNLALNPFYNHSIQNNPFL